MRWSARRSNVTAECVTTGVCNRKHVQYYTKHVQHYKCQMKQQCTNSVPIVKNSQTAKMTIGVPIVTCLHRVPRIHKVSVRVRVRRIHKASERA